jgi:hypothetical protein
MSITGQIPDELPEYWRDLYGDATIAWVPPVHNYDYPHNYGIRTVGDRDFTWEEVTVQLEDVQDQAIVDFLVPDTYVIQITPDIGWSNVLAMFGEDEELGLNNPHLWSSTTFSIEHGTLVDNGDGSVTATLTESSMRNATVPGFTKYLWRAVPWANGNPGLGGLPVKFEYVNSFDLLKFTIDEIIKETRKPIQTISGTKAPLVTLKVEEDNNPDLIIEQTENTWRISFTIDRSNIRFRIKATDENETLVGYHKVDIDYDSFEQIDGHVWNTFDSFGLTASLERLPNEFSASLRERIIDAFQNRGSSNYAGLVFGVNRDLGIERYDSALKITRAENISSIPLESSVFIDVTHTRIGVEASSFVIDNEVHKIDTYFNTVYTNKRISRIKSIVNEKNVEIPETMYLVTDDPEGNEIELDRRIRGIIKITYQYVEDIDFNEYPLIGDVREQLVSLKSPAGETLFDIAIDERLTGSESSKNLYQIYGVLNRNTTEFLVGWSPVGLHAIPNPEWKRSFRADDSTFFESDFYQYVVELRSQTHIEWGRVVADRDRWDAVESEQYGRDSLPIAFDTKLSNYALTVPTNSKFLFDPWEAFRVGYYYNGNLIKNSGFPKSVFRSGVGYKKDCIVGLEVVSLSAPEDKINQNPVVESPESTVDLDDDAINDIVISF